MITDEKKFQIVMQGLSRTKPLMQVCAENRITEAQFREWEARVLEHGHHLFDGRIGKIEIYHSALAAARYEGKLLWQIFGVFLLIHTVNVGFILQGITSTPGPSNHLRTLLEGVLGAVLCVVWAATYSRNSAHYRFYLARARETEPSEWHLYGGKGQEFSLGEATVIGHTHHQLSWHANWVRSGRMVPPVYCCFFLIYILAIVLAVCALKSGN